MIIGPLAAAECSEVAALARLTGSGFDPCAELARPWARIWVARRADGTPAIGFALAWRAADEMHLLDLAVSPEARRTGIGRSLVGAVLGEAGRTDARLVLLEVRASNAPALALYRSLGFFEHGVRRGYYSDNGEDAIEMRFELSSDNPPHGTSP